MVSPSVLKSWCSLINNSDSNTNKEVSSSNSSLHLNNSSSSNSNSSNSNSHRWILHHPNNSKQGLEALRETSNSCLRPPHLHPPQVGNPLHYPAQPSYLSDSVETDLSALLCHYWYCSGAIKMLVVVTITVFRIFFPKIGILSLLSDLAECIYKVIDRYCCSVFAYPKKLHYCLFVEHSWDICPYSHYIGSK